jgi:PAS domain S-box-containing protein
MSDPPSLRGRPPVLIGWAVLGLALAVTLRPGSAHLVVMGDPVSAGLGGLAALACSYTAWRRSGPMRRSWLCFGTTLVMWTVADLLWYAYGTADGYHSILSAADALYLLGLVPTCLGLVLYPVGAWESGARLRLLLDVVVLGSALLLISELVVLGEVVRKEGVTWDAFVYAVYPVTDILLAGLAALLLRSTERRRPDLVLIGLAFLCWTLADNGYALMSVRGQDYAGTVVDLGYVVAPALLGLAAMHALDTGGRERVVRRHVTGTVAPLLPDFAALLALALSVISGLDGWPEWTLAATVLVLAGGRQIARTLDNQRLHWSLEQRVEDRTADLAKLSERHQRILDSVGEGIFGVDRRQRISFANPAAAALLGWPTGELLGRDACRTLCDERHDECLVSMVMALGEPVTQTARTYCRHDGSTFPVEVTAAPQVGPDGTTGAVVVFRDITERAVLDGMKQQFVSAVSHELRTPLTAIRGALELLGDGDVGELPAGAQRVVDVAARGTERLTRLVNDIIDMERLEAGAFSLENRPQDLEPLITEAGASLMSLAAEHGVRLVIGPAHGRALCDADRVIQALVNLMGNAIKFTPHDHRVQVTARPLGHEVIVEVTDEGRGIPPEDLDAVFERFHQVESADARALGGTGLGLAITKAIVDRHGGHIWVESEVGVGSTFRFTLPLAVEPAEDQTPSTNSPAAVSDDSREVAAQAYPSPA